MTGVEGVPLEPDMGLPVISLWIFSFEERMSLGDGWGRGGGGVRLGCECVRGGVLACRGIAPSQQHRLHRQG